MGPRAGGYPPGGSQHRERCPSGSPRLSSGANVKALPPPPLPFPPPQKKRYSAYYNLADWLVNNPDKATVGTPAAESALGREGDHPCRRRRRARTRWRRTAAAEAPCTCHEQRSCQAKSTPKVQAKCTASPRSPPHTHTHAGPRPGDQRCELPAAVLCWRHVGPPQLPRGGRDGAAPRRGAQQLRLDHTRPGKWWEGSGVAVGVGVTGCRAGVRAAAGPRAVCAGRAARAGAVLGQVCHNPSKQLRTRTAMEHARTPHPPAGAGACVPAVSGPGRDPPRPQARRPRAAGRARCARHPRDGACARAGAGGLEACKAARRTAVC